MSDGSGLTVNDDSSYNWNGTLTDGCCGVAGNGTLPQWVVSDAFGTVNTPPAAANDAAVTDEDTPVTVAVLANDTDGDGDALTVTAAGPASNGSTTTDGVTVSYTPNANFHGVELLHLQHLRRAGRRGLGPGRRHGQPGQRPAQCPERCG